MDNARLSGSSTTHFLFTATFKRAAPSAPPTCGRPLKQAVIAVIGKTGYALSWIARADRLGISPEELCDRFKTDPNRVKKLWAELTAENEKAKAE
jgi:hypothetical protein